MKRTRNFIPCQAWRIPACLILLAIFVCSVIEPAASAASRHFDRITIDALDPDAWSGIVFLARAYTQPAFFALRIGSLSCRAFLDGPDIFNAVREVGPHAPDGSYCRMAWEDTPRARLVTLEWSKIDQTTVIGQITAAQDFRLLLVAYPPYLHAFPSPIYFSLANKNQVIVGKRFFDNIIGHPAWFVVMIDRPAIGSGIFTSSNEMDEALKGTGKLTSQLDRGPTPGMAGLEFSTGGAATAHFVATLGWDKNELLSKARTLISSGKIGTIIQVKSEAYAHKRPTVKGEFEGSAEAIGNSMFWNTLYDPTDKLVFPSISRKWAERFGGWAVGEWDCFFGALLTSLEDKNQTNAGLRAILSAQSNTGVVPNLASGSGDTPDRSQPPVGSYIVWKIYERYRDREMLEWAYPRLKKWHHWWFANRGDGQPWRDGNRDGLLEWGTNLGSMAVPGGRGGIVQAKYESGMDDSPMYDQAIYNSQTNTMNLDDVGLNSLYTLDAECLSKIAAILGENQDSQKFASEYRRMQQAVRSGLWNEQDGMYENRFWNGQFSHRLSPTNFYPMIAGIATPQQAERMVREHLLNTKEFWGTYVIPTATRNDPAFGDQFYWRGDIWGPTNYLVYEGLNRYGFDDVAREFAEKSYNLFMGDWKTNQHTDENYRVWGGNGGGDPHYTWGALLCLISLEQYLDENPWSGLRFGSLNPFSPGELHHTIWGSHLYDVKIGPRRTTLSRDGILRFEANSGVVVRNYETTPSRLSFIVKSKNAIRITTGEFPAGKLRLSVDGHESGNIEVSGGRVSFTAPEGEHKVNLEQLDR